MSTRPAESEAHDNGRSDRDGIETVIVGDEFLTAQQVSQLLGYSHTSGFYQAVYEGLLDDLPAYRRGRRYYFKDCEVSEFIETRTAEFRATRAPLSEHRRHNQIDDDTERETIEGE